MNLRDDEGGRMKKRRKEGTFGDLYTRLPGSLPSSHYATGIGGCVWETGVDGNAINQRI